MVMRERGLKGRIAKEWRERSSEWKKGERGAYFFTVEFSFDVKTTEPTIVAPIEMNST